MGTFYYIVCDDCKKYQWVEKLHPNRVQQMADFMRWGTLVDGVPGMGHMTHKLRLLADYHDRELEEVFENYEEIEESE